MPRHEGSPAPAWRRLTALAAIGAALLAAGCLEQSGDSNLSPPLEGPAPAEPDCLSQVRDVNLHRATIADLQQALSEGRLTSRDLVDAYVARIAAFDSGGPALNSVRTIHPTARAQAEALDSERAAGNVRGPLHGIPILLKDNVGTKDQPTTAGSIALANNVPPEDATLTVRLREDGAIILGKLNLSEFANWVSLRMPSGYSSLGGQVINAYTGGNPSGSSSGSGVAGSMALAAGTIGTETSGSILSPSNLNSLVGLKPTTGLVSRAGVIPLAANFDTPGPMTRTVADAAAILSSIAGPDPRDPITAASAGHLPPNGDYAAALNPGALGGARFGYDPNSQNPIFAQARDDLARLGAVLVPISDNNLDAISILEIGLIPNEFKFGINRYLAEDARAGLPVKDLTEIILYNQQHPDKVKYGQDLLIASDASPGIGPFGDAAASAVISANRRVADDLFSKDRLDAIVGFGAPYTGLGAAAGYPTVVVPAGYEDRTPRGLSFFGPAWSEARLLSFAHAYEQSTHRREPPTAVNPSLLGGVCSASGEAPYGIEPAGQGSRVGGSQD